MIYMSTDILLKLMVCSQVSLVAQMVKNLPAMQKTPVQSPVSGSGRSPGERNGYPLQYSCLENSMDRGAWQATVHGVQNTTEQLTLSLFITFNLFKWPMGWTLILIIVTPNVEDKCVDSKSIFIIIIILIFSRMIGLHIAQVWWKIITNLKIFGLFSIRVLMFHWNFL